MDFGIPSGGGDVLSVWSGLRRTKLQHLACPALDKLEESTEIMTIFPWYSYLVSLFILALDYIAVPRKTAEPFL